MPKEGIRSFADTILLKETNGFMTRAEKQRNERKRNMEKQITANDVKEFFLQRDKEISNALWETNNELSKKARETKDDEMLSDLATKAMIAQKKAMDETQELILLCLGAVSMYTKPYYCRHIKLIASAMEAPGEDSEYFKETTDLLNAIFRSEVISMPGVRKNESK